MVIISFNWNCERNNEVTCNETWGNYLLQLPSIPVPFLLYFHLSHFVCQFRPLTHSHWVFLQIKIQPSHLRLLIVHFYRVSDAWEVCSRRGPSTVWGERESQEKEMKQNHESQDWKWMLNYSVIAQLHSIPVVISNHFAPFLSVSFSHDDDDHHLFHSPHSHLTSCGIHRMTKLQGTRRGIMRQNENERERRKIL